MRSGIHALALLACVTMAVHAREMRVRVTYVAADGLYVDAGAGAGLAVGDAGVVLRDGLEIGRARVAAVAGDSARLQRTAGSAEARPGDEVVFEITRGPATEPAPGPGKRSEASEPFVPLLERNRRIAEARARSNVSHGWASWRTSVLAVAEEVETYVRTSLSSTGALERFRGRRWALRWSGTLSARGGDAFDSSTLEGARLDVYELTLDVRIGADGLLRIGRFLPRALGSAGFLDGGLFETAVSETARVGVALGLRPTRDDLAPTLDEPTTLVYTTIATGRRSGRRFRGTFGVLGSLFEGDLDRVAVLGDQSLSLGDRLFTGASFEIDFDTGAAAFRTGTRLTRLDVYVSGRISARLTLRAGLDHWERVDTRAERQQLESADASQFGSGFWRYWIGTVHALGERWTLETELVFFAGAASGDDPRWRVTASRRGLFDLEHATASLTVYSLEGADASGVGGLLAAYVPAGRWTIRPSVGLRVFDGGLADTTDARVRVTYEVSRRWTAEVGLVQVLGGTGEATTLDFGLRYRW